TPLHSLVTAFSCSFSYASSGDHRHLHSFPTRRSSDLRLRLPASGSRRRPASRQCTTPSPIGPEVEAARTGPAGPRGAHRPFEFRQVLASKHIRRWGRHAAPRPEHWSNSKCFLI